ncbi:MAG: valine--tRNA ligase, partial [Bacilli bacterium]
MKLHELSTKYDFNQVETGKYEKWLKEGYFTAGQLDKKPYTIVIPPPNVTGKLHLGHVWDTTLQDIIIRRKRMMGYDALFLPGMDHASIATQAKVEAKLRTQGISRYDLGREKFLDISWKWKDEYAKLIREQWAVIGLGLDYTRERFTLDAGLNHAVNTVFIKMFEDGLIYRGEKIINWDVHSQTALSNIEVEYKEVEGAFYHIIYPFVGEKGGLEIATTRPETMFGDVALMVHSKDSRYLDVIGKSVYLPGTNRVIPVIADDYVDPQFGTGVVKVTPAHDPNDFEVGLRHHLDRPLCMTEDGHMNEMAGKYQGMERFACRKQVVDDLKNAGLLVKVKRLVHSVGHSERTGVIVEPRLSKQWFVKMQPLADLIIAQQQTRDKIQFIPARFEKTFLNWLTNIQDWCISRQLWWGHRIPAWYREDQVFVGLTPPTQDGWVQDEDALDTWFSSALWPFSTLGWPEQTADYQRYFPTDTLVTGYDIIFFWVARMAFQSKYLTGKVPFKQVLIHGIIRDEQGRKVSKSLGNGVDMMDAVNQYGMDALRYFLTTSSSPGQDIRYSDEKMEASWNYINKIWNISRFIGMNLEKEGYHQELIDEKLLTHVDKWILKRLNQVIDRINYYYEGYKFGEVAKVLYHFVWDEFASWYLEMTKVTFSNRQSNVKVNTCAVLNTVLSAILKMLHPFMPFVTDE